MLRGHGGEVLRLARELGVPPLEVQDHSSNLSPLPPPAGFYELLRDHLREVELLPEVASDTLREALARAFDLPEEAVFPSAGTTEWIFALPRVLAWRSALVLGPTYADYADALRAAGVPCRYLLAREEDSFRPDPDRLRRAAREHDAVFLCNPNNPTGTYLPRATLARLVGESPGTTFVVDESYLDFHPRGESLLGLRPFPENLVVLRSFSKIYRVPGLRLGFCVVGASLREALARAVLPWSVNRLAQVAGPWLLARRDHVRAVVRLVQRERERVLPRLAALPGARVFPGEVHFFLLKTPGPARPLWEALWRRFRILTREASNFVGLGPAFLRLALKTPEENDRLLEALREVWR